MMPPLAPPAYTIQRVRRGKRAAGLDAEARALLEYADFPIGCHQRVHAVALCENSVVGAVVVDRSNAGCFSTMFSVHAREVGVLVTPAHQRRGLASKLVKDVYWWLADRGKTLILVPVTDAGFAVCRALNTEFDRTINDDRSDPIFLVCNDDDEAETTYSTDDDALNAISSDSTGPGDFLWGWASRRNQQKATQLPRPNRKSNLSHDKKQDTLPSLTNG